MLMNFAVALVFLITATAVVWIAVFISKRFQIPNPGKLKNTSYECGEIPEGDAKVNFNPRFYNMALAFLIFDVEIALIYPVSVKFRDFLKNGEGLIALIEILLFAWVLFLGLLYLWRNGYLDWSESADEKSGAAQVQKQN